MEKLVGNDLKWEFEGSNLKQKTLNQPKDRSKNVDFWISEWNFRYEGSCTANIYIQYTHVNADYAMDFLGHGFSVVFVF